MVCAVRRPASAALARQASTNTTFAVNGDDEASKVPPVAATATATATALAPPAFTSAAPYSGGWHYM